MPADRSRRAAPAPTMDEPTIRLVWVNHDTLRGDRIRKLLRDDPFCRAIFEAC